MQPFFVSKYSKKISVQALVRAGVHTKERSNIFCVENKGDHIHIHIQAAIAQQTYSNIHVLNRRHRLRVGRGPGPHKDQSI